MTRCGGEAGKEEVFDSELDPYEAKTIFIGRHHLHLRGDSEAQAQLILDVYPSQDNSASETLWIFSGFSQTTTSWSIRSSGTYSARDSWEVGGNLFNANKPDNQTITLSPLFSSSNTNDIDSVRARIPGGVRTNITFAAHATNTPTIIFSGNSSRTIASFYLDEDPSDEDDMGIRVSGSNFSYSSSTPSSWTGAGIISKSPSATSLRELSVTTKIWPLVLRLPAARCGLSSTAKSSPNQKNTRWCSARLHWVLCSFIAA